MNLGETKVHFAVQSWRSSAMAFHPQGWRCLVGELGSTIWETSLAWFGTFYQKTKLA